MTNSNAPNSCVLAIRHSNLTIYDPIEIGDPKLWISTSKLEELLDAKMTGIPLAGLPLRTRSKVVKEHICRALGYPVPSRFRKTRPRFPGQLFDTYVQKSTNLQIWNEEIASARRYVIIRVGRNDVITKVRVVTGNTLAQLDRTGTLTQKYQARVIWGQTKVELIATEDTDRIQPFVQPAVDLGSIVSPINHPREGQLLAIGQILEKLEGLIGKSFPDAGYDQERNRGAALHQLVCKQLGYTDYRDDGQFPDVRHQLLEVKLQTSPTIDLGLVCPNSEEALHVPKVAGRELRTLRRSLRAVLRVDRWGSRHPDAPFPDHR